MLETFKQNDEVSTIVAVLSAKSKRTFAHRKKSLLEQAKYFSPIYRDFIIKVINNKSLEIVHSYDESYLLDKNISEENLKVKLTKKSKNKIFIEIEDVDALPHELGHAVDFYFGKENSLSRSVILEDNKTLYDIFSEEFEEKHHELYELVMTEYKQAINSSINKEAFDILIRDIPKYRELCSIKIDLDNKEVTAKRKQLQKELYESNFVETYYELYMSRCYCEINKKYSPILDALSSRYNLEGLFLDHHKESYYERDKYNAVYEFFGNLFRARVTSQNVYTDNLIKYLPKSFLAFEKLFDIFYEHIQNNRKFNDIKLKTVS
ncbi:MAG: hypothetical protein SPL00_04305 [Bacilli bacterium]|nr:hypothetical protein [Bacilli bacterium]